MTGAGTRYKYEVREAQGGSERQTWRDEQGQIVFSISSRGNGDMVDGFRQENGLIRFVFKKF